MAAARRRAGIVTSEHDVKVQQWRPGCSYTDYATVGDLSAAATRLLDLDRKARERPAVLAGLAAVAGLPVAMQPTLINSRVGLEKFMPETWLAHGAARRGLGRAAHR